MTKASSGIEVLKANGKREQFIPEKLKESLMRSGAQEDIALDVLSRVEGGLYDGITTEEIYRSAFKILREIERPVAHKYSLRRAVMDLGPTGFPFEEFIAEMMRIRGYKALTGQMVMGSCVSHEVDVIAWKGDELIMAETKFHNSLGTKSDLKVALYVKARFDDIQGNIFNYGDKDREVSDAWLVTNTKFSSTAIHYAECKGLKLMGWNYPKKDNLQNMIEEVGLHPITCLETLSDDQKKLLVSNGIMLCSKIRLNPGVLNEILGKEFESESVIKEINEL